MNALATFTSDILSAVSDRRPSWDSADAARAASSENVHVLSSWPSTPVQLRRQCSVRDAKMSVEMQELALQDLFRVLLLTCPTEPAGASHPPAQDPTEEQEESPPPRSAPQNVPHGGGQPAAADKSTTSQAAGAGAGGTAPASASDQTKDQQESSDDDHGAEKEAKPSPPPVTVYAPAALDANQVQALRDGVSAALNRTFLPHWHLKYQPTRRDRSAVRNSQFSLHVEIAAAQRFLLWHDPLCSMNNPSGAAVGNKAASGSSESSVDPKPNEKSGHKLGGFLKSPAHRHHRDHRDLPHLHRPNLFHHSSRPHIRSPHGRNTGGGSSSNSRSSSSGGRGSSSKGRSEGAADHPSTPLRTVRWRPSLSPSAKTSVVSSRASSESTAPPLQQHWDLLAVSRKGMSNMKGLDMRTQIIDTVVLGLRAHRMVDDKPVSLDVKLKDFVQNRLDEVYGPSWFVAIAPHPVSHVPVLGTLYLCGSVGEGVQFTIWHKDKSSSHKV